jgi:hypothetical protein
MNNHERAEIKALALTLLFLLLLLAGIYGTIKAQELNTTVMPLSLNPALQVEGGKAWQNVYAGAGVVGYAFAKDNLPPVVPYVTAGPVIRWQNDNRTYLLLRYEWPTQIGKESPHYARWGGMFRHYIWRVSVDIGYTSNAPFVGVGWRIGG